MCVEVRQVLLSGGPRLSASLIGQFRKSHANFEAAKDLIYSMHVVALEIVFAFVCIYLNRLCVTTMPVYLMSPTFSPHRLFGMKHGSRMCTLKEKNVSKGSGMEVSGLAYSG